MKRTIFMGIWPALIICLLTVLSWGHGSREDNPLADHAIEQFASVQNPK